MFVYYKLYREPVSPTSRSGKKWQAPALRLCTRRQDAFVLFLRTNVLILCWPIDRSGYNLNKLLISTRGGESSVSLALTLTSYSSSESDSVCASIEAEETAARASQP